MIYTKDELCENLLLEDGDLVKVGKQYWRSASTIRRWCKDMGINLNDYRTIDGKTAFTRKRDLERLNNELVNVIASLEDFAADEQDEDLAASVRMVKDQLDGAYVAIEDIIDDD